MLYTNGPGNIFSQTCLIAADLANVQVEVVFKDKAAANEKEFKAKNLTGKFPLYEAADGSLLSESTAIAAHFARSASTGGLFGQTPFEAAKVEEWISFTQTQLWPNVMRVGYPALGHVVIDQSDFADRLKALKAVAKTLDTYLKGKHFLVGDNLTVADVCAACSLLIAFQTVFDAGFRKAMPNISEWFERCMGLPSFVRRLGYVKMVEKAFKAWDPKAKPEPVQAPAPAKVEKPKEEDDDLDLFGDDDDDNGVEAAKQAAKDAAAKKKKKVVIAQSLVMFEVKPLDSDTDLDALAKRIFEIKMDGLYWKTEYKKEPVAFGIFKLIIGVTVEDEKVSVDGLQEQIEAFEDAVQSVEILAFNKI